jgi:DNA (cytosine-5)-methyltransferase 1
MKHGSLFSGIGGFDLAAQWMGWENVFHCEWNPFGQKVLKHYWPNAESHEDITKTDFTKYRGTIDIVSGGFPCQPYSSAGKRKGKEDERHLWPQMLRAIREISPRYVVGENVLGLTNWDGGIVFDEVHIDLEREGYEVAAVVVPAAAVNAPHGRDRVWFVAKRIVADAVRDSNGNDDGKVVGTPGEVRRRTSGDVLDEFRGVGVVAHADGERSEVRTHDAEIQRNIVATNTSGIVTNADGGRGLQGREDIQPKQSNGPGFVGNGRERDVADTKGQRFAERDGKDIGNVPTSHGFEQFSRPTRWEAFPTQPPLCGGNDGVPAGLDGITFPKWRSESLKAYGNAIVPQVAFEIFKSIDHAGRIYDDLKKQTKIE